MKQANSEKILVKQSEVHQNLFLINHSLSFPYNLKFHFISLFHLLMQLHVKKILKKINHGIDIIWSFDLGNLYPFSFFPKKSFKIFHPVDEPLNKTAIDSAKGAQIIFSVTREIIDKYAFYTVPKHFVNHGVDTKFLIQDFVIKNDKKIRVGFGGNLWRTDIDRKVLLKIIHENPDVLFECWGSYQTNTTNMSGAMVAAASAFVDQLKKNRNVLLHGPVSTAILARELQRMDAFLICYDVQKDQSKGTNYHKLMEFMSTGKIIISNNITAYKDYPELVEMVAEREHNKMLPALFKKIINGLADYNSQSAQQKRKNFALDNTYEKQLMRIEQLISHDLKSLISPKP